MFLLAAVVSSGIMGERLARGNVAVALLANTVANGVALVALTPVRSSSVGSWRGDGRPVAAYWFTASTSLRIPW